LVEDMPVDRLDLRPQVGLDLRNGMPEMLSGGNTVELGRGSLTRP